MRFGFIALPGETVSRRQSRRARWIAEDPTIVHGEMATRLFLESYLLCQQKANWDLLRRQSRNHAIVSKSTLRHVADVIHKEENQQVLSEMQSLKAFTSSLGGSEST